MITPATICFREEGCVADFYVYLPDHGSLGEVAEALYKTLLNPSPGNKATQFIRANANSGLTENFDWNFNSYQYIFTQGDDEYDTHLTVYEVKTERHFTNTKGIFSGDLIDFLQEQLDPNGSNNMFRTVHYPYSTQVMTREMAHMRILDLLDNLRTSVTPTLREMEKISSFQYVMALVNAFPELMPKELEEIGVVVPQPLKEKT